MDVDSCPFRQKYGHTAQTVEMGCLVVSWIIYVVRYTQDTSQYLVLQTVVRAVCLLLRLVIDVTRRIFEK